MPEFADVVVVGGGIAGSSLAYSLAREGLGVTVLEATDKYEDRVRGESMQLWGVREARQLGVEQVLLDAGAFIAPMWKQYMEGYGEVGDIPMGALVERIDGTLNLRHPLACQALAEAATAAGAKFVTGATEIEIARGVSPTVTYAADRNPQELVTTLIVGADGRASTIRRQAGITLERQAPANYIAGLLVDGLEGVPENDVLAGEGDVFFAMFHQGNGRARVYICPGLSGQHRFAGPEGTKRFLESCALSCYPWSDRVAASTPAGPCATYPGDDTWTATPFAEGIVLIGDAAGHNDPIIGQGLSIALRDAHLVRDIIVNGGRSPEAFASYGAERMGRMTRLRFLADIISVSHAEDAQNRPARRAFIVERMARFDPEIMALFRGMFTGPELIPDELIDEGLLERIRTA